MVALPHPPREASLLKVPRSVRLAFIALLIVASLRTDLVTASSRPAQFYVESTGHILADPFLRFWVENDGAELLGMPVSDIVELDGRTAQFFRYGVLVHKANDETTRLRAGVDLLRATQSNPALIDGRHVPVTNTAQAEFGNDTVHQTVERGAAPVFAIDASILPYYQNWQGDEVLGAPITAAYEQNSDLTQWFEFGRIDLGSAGATLAETGLELARALDVPTDPADRGTLPLFDPARFVTFTGDGTVPNADQPFDPVRLQIPKIKVDAAIEVTTVEDGVMTNPVDPWKAGWYQSFSRPGEWTNTVIAGHRDWWGYGPVVFWDLGWLQPGDKIYLTGADGSGATYVVGEVQVVPRTVDPQTIINDVGYEALTLITCGGSWTGTEYTSRIIIRAYRI